MKKTILIPLILISLVACKQEKKETPNQHVKYMSFNDPDANFTGIQGIRGVLDSKDVYIAGTFTTAKDDITHGVIYKGPLSDSGNSGTWYQLDYTSTQFNDVTLTSCYGPTMPPMETFELWVLINAPPPETETWVFCMKDRFMEMEHGPP